MFFVCDPYAPTPTFFDTEQTYEDYCRRQYVTALKEQQRRVQFERELQLEEQRHRRALASIAQQEAARRQTQASPRYPRHPQQHISGACVCGHDADACIMPDSQEIFRRRQARQQEEERLSREFHKQILSQIFGALPGEMDQPTQEGSPITQNSSILAQGKETTTNPSDAKETLSTAAQIHADAKNLSEPSRTTKESTPKQAIPKAPVAKQPDMGKQQGEEAVPHWSAAVDRAKALAELTSVTRAFTSLKNTFVFPSGRLERAPDDTSGVPRLAYNQTNAAIHAYQHALGELLARLDGIESYGFNGVRETRKQLVVKVEMEMEELEKKIVHCLSEPATPSASQGAPTTTDASRSKDREDKVMSDEKETSAPLVTKAAGGYKVAPSEPVPSIVEAIIPEHKITTSSVPEVLASTGVEPLESQAKEKEAMDIEVPVPDNFNTPTSANAPIADKRALVPSEGLAHPISPAASHLTSPHAKTFTVSDDDSEIEDAVKTVV